MSAVAVLTNGLEDSDDVENWISSGRCSTFVQEGERATGGMTMEIEVERVRTEDVDRATTGIGERECVTEEDYCFGW